MMETPVETDGDLDGDMPELGSRDEDVDGTTGDASAFPVFEMLASSAARHLDVESMVSSQPIAPLPCCKLLGCTASRAWSSEYCVKHMCLIKGCIRPNATRALGDDRELHCVEHLEPAFRGRGTCCATGCSAPCPLDDAYCAEHKCRIRGCGHLRWDGCPTDYCVYHTCKSGACYVARAAESPECIMCFQRRMKSWYNENMHSPHAPGVARLLNAMSGPPQ